MVLTRGKPGWPNIVSWTASASGGEPIQILDQQLEHLQVEIFGGDFFFGTFQRLLRNLGSPPIFRFNFSRCLLLFSWIFGVFNSLASWICSCKKRTCGLWIWNHWFGVMFGIGSIQQFGLFREYVFDLSGTGDATYPKVFPRPKMNLIYPDWIVLKQASANLPL